MNSLLWLRKTGLDNILLPTLFQAVNNSKQHCYTWLGLNTAHTRYCSILFSSNLNKLFIRAHFLLCRDFLITYTTIKEVLEELIIIQLHNMKTMLHKEPFAHVVSMTAAIRQRQADKLFALGSTRGLIAFLMMTCLLSQTHVSTAWPLSG